MSVFQTFTVALDSFLIPPRAGAAEGESGQCICPFQGRWAPILKLNSHHHGGPEQKDETIKSMNIPNTVPANQPSPQSYCVWFFCASADELADHAKHHAIWQDVIVVAAGSEEHALEIAKDLLEARCEFETTITHVMARAELQRVLRVLQQVEGGALPAATLADNDHLEWAERFTYNTAEKTAAT